MLKAEPGLETPTQDVKVEVKFEVKPEGSSTNSPDDDTVEYAGDPAEGCVIPKGKLILSPLFSCFCSNPSLDFGPYYLQKHRDHCAPSSLGYRLVKACQ